MKTATTKLTPGQRVHSCASCSRSRDCCSFIRLKLKLVPLSPPFDFQTLWENQVSFGCSAMFPCGVCLPCGSIATAQRSMAWHGISRHRGVFQVPGAAMAEGCSPAAPCPMPYGMPSSCRGDSSWLPIPWLFGCSCTSLPLINYQDSLNGRTYCPLNRGWDVLALGSRKDSFAANEVGDIIWAVLRDSRAGREQHCASALGRGSGENLLVAYESQTKSG